MNVLILDDQEYVVEGIHKGVNWNRVGIKEVFKANSAQEAREILMEHNIDILLSDIEMPGENGLELTKWMKEQHMQTRYIFISAHADFQYAKEALQLGGVDYILQPAKYSDIESAIRKATLSIITSRNEKKFYYYGKYLSQEWNKLADVLAQKWYEAPLEIEIGKSLLEHLRIIDYILQEVNQTVLFLWETVGKTPVDMGFTDDLLRASLLNIICEVFEYWKMKIYAFNIDKETYLFMLVNDKETELSKDELLPLVANVHEAISVFLKLKSNIYLSKPDSFIQLGAQLAVLKNMRKNNFSKYNRSRLFCWDDVDQLTAQYDIQYPDRNVEESLLMQGQGKSVYEETNAFINALIEQNALNTRVLKTIHADFMKMLFSLEKTTGTKFEDIFTMEEEEEKALSAFESLDSLKHFILMVTSYFTDPKEKAGKENEQIKQITQYVYENLDKDLRRDDIAVYVFLNPNYISRLFKNNMGISLKEFIIKKKMEMARTLLRTTKLPVSAVAVKVGYTNFSHFSQLYRREYNLSPAEERKCIKEKSN